MQGYTPRVWNGSLTVQWADESDDDWLARMHAGTGVIVPVARTAARREVRDL